MTEQEHYQALIAELKLIRGYFDTRSTHIAAIKIDQRLEDIYEVTEPYDDGTPRPTPKPDTED